MRLNGWQRLWIVIMALYLILVGGTMYLEWPTVERMRHRDEFITRMPAELKAHVDAAYDSEYEWSKHHGYPGEMKVEAKKTSEGGKRVNPLPKELMGEVEPKGKDAPLPPGFVLV